MARDVPEQSADMRSWYARAADGYGAVLVLLTAVFVLVGVSDNPVGFTGLVLCASGALVLSYRASGVRPTVMRAVFVLTALLALSALVTGPSGDTYTSLPTPILLAVLVGAGPIVIVRGILGHERVSRDTILGAVCGYVYLGLVFEFVYAALAGLDPDPFFSSGAEVTFSSLNYFSFVTLTTLGYGDLTPAGSVARQIATIEAMAGQIYLVTLIARLVGLFSGRRFKT